MCAALYGIEGTCGQFLGDRLIELISAISLARLLAMGSVGFFRCWEEFCSILLIEVLTFGHLNELKDVLIDATFARHETHSCLERFTIIIKVSSGDTLTQLATYHPCLRRLLRAWPTNWQLCVTVRLPFLPRASSKVMLVVSSEYEGARAFLLN